MLVAYIQDQSVTPFLEEQLQAMELYDYQELYIDKGKNQQQSFKIIEHMKPHDTFLVYQLACLGMPLRALATFFKEMRHRQLSFISIQDQLQFDDMQENPLFLYYLDLLNDTDGQVRSKRTIEGIKELKRRGKANGRPAIKQQKIDEIRRLREQKFSCRKIAMLCEVSVGAVHKYIKKETEKQAESRE